MHHRGMVISRGLLARGQVEGLAHAGFDEALVNIHVALLTGINAHVPGRIGVVEVKQAIRLWGDVAYYRIFRIAAVQARTYGEGKEYGYVSKVADDWKFS